MRRRSGSSVGRRSSTLRRRSENLRFDEFGFALTKRKEQKVNQRCHDYSFPQLGSVRVKELCELLSYWNGASFICRSQAERFVRMGIPPSLRGRVWTCLLSTDGLKENSLFSYQKCLAEVRGPLVDLGVSEYAVPSAIAALGDTQNQNRPDPNRTSSADDVALFRQVALDLQRSFPTHRSLMGQSPEAIEGRAKLFRVLVAYARYNPRVGYSQGMSYIAAVLLMHLGEEEAFWALAAMLDEPKHLSELFDLHLDKVRHQVKVFDRFLKHRKPELSQHLDRVGVASVHFVTPWFLTLFTSLPCWDSVLAAWDLIILHGLSAVFRTALTIMELLEPRLMELNDEGSVLPLLLRVPVSVAQYTTLVPALWSTDVQDWELKCMNSLVLDESHHGPKTAGQSEDEKTTPSSRNGDGKDASASASSGEKVTDKSRRVSGAKSVLTRVMSLAQRFLFDPVARHKTQTTTKAQQQQQQQHRSRTSASLTQAQVRSRRRSHQHQQQQQRRGGDVAEAESTASREKSDRSDQTLKRSGTGPAGKAPRHRHGNHGNRVKSLRLPRNRKNPTNQALPSPPSTLRPPLPEQDTSRTAVIKELSSRHQTSVPLGNTRESELI